MHAKGLPACVFMWKLVYAWWLFLSKNEAYKVHEPCEATNGCVVVEMFQGSTYLFSCRQFSLRDFMSVFTSVNFRPVQAAVGHNFSESYLRELEIFHVWLVSWLGLSRHPQEKFCLNRSLLLYCHPDNPFYLRERIEQLPGFYDVRSYVESSGAGFLHQAIRHPVGVYMWRNDLEDGEAVPEQNPDVQEEEMNFLTAAEEAELRSYSIEELTEFCASFDLPI